MRLSAIVAPLCLGPVALASFRERSDMEVEISQVAGAAVVGLWCYASFRVEAG